ncbi:hypothetical protein M1437_00270 [Patescibacteria group bacterium]|nr:hypothetical protein [Patescibacteria group bacterium]
MLKYSKTKLFIAGISLISILIIVVASVIKESKLPFFTKPIPLTTPSPKIPNVLYPIAPDPSGRNIYYIMNDTGKNLRYSGVGVQTLSPGTKFTNDKGNVVFTNATSSAMTSYIVGSFKAWEDIPNSKDKYLLLEDLLQTRDFDRN